MQEQYDIIPIKLTQGKFALIDANDYQEVRKYNWWVSKNGPRGTVLYARAYASKFKKTSGGRTRVRSIPMHRFIVGLDYDDKRFVDHRNGNTLDNRRSNLRICSHRENTLNRRRVNLKTGYKGVSRRKDGWRADISIMDGSINLGVFDSPLRAAIAYDVAAIKHHGEFALTNKMLGLLDSDNEIKIEIKGFQPKTLAA